MATETDRIDLIREGSSFRIEFRRDADRLRAFLTGVVSSLDRVNECWRLIAEETVRSSVSMLLVVDATSSEALSLDELEQFTHDMRGHGLESIRVAYVGGDATQAALHEAAEIFARERGFVARAFGIESEALLWLRHGER